MTEGSDERPEYGAQSPEGQSPEGQQYPPPQQPQWGQQPYGQQPYPQQPYPQPYGQQPYAQQPYAPQPYAPPYGSPPYGVPGYGGPPGPGLPPGVRLASWGQRALALLLDGLFGALLYLPGILLVTFGAVRAEDTGDDGVAATLIVLGSLLMLVALVVQFWNQGWRQGAQGWSWGKQVMKIKLLRIADGRPPGGGVGLGRLLVRSLLGGFTGGIYTVLTYLWPLWDERRQTLDDKIFSTIVAEV